MMKLADIKKITQLSVSDYVLMTEGFVYLLISNFLIYLLPMRWWVNWIGKAEEAESNASLTETQKRKLVKVRKNLFRANKLLLNSSRCFALSLALKKMLARRSISVSLYLGVNKANEGNLQAHAWVKSGAAVIYGGQNASDKYTQLISFG
jgi:hypothetical protein